MGAPVQDIRDLDQVESAAMLAGDVDSLQQVWHDEFIVNNPFNVVVNRDAVLEAVRGRRIAYLSFDRTTEAVSIIGDTAITMGEEVVVPGDGAPLAGQNVTRRYTHVWILSGNRWRLAARQASIVNSTPP